MRVFYDGLIYGIQQVGGPVRVFNELIPRIAAADGVDATLSLRLGLRRPACMAGVRTVGCLTLPEPYASLHPLRRALDGLLRPAERFWCGLRAGRPDVLHPTYYVSPRKSGVPTVVTVYDMIHERFPEFYPGAENDRFRVAKAACIRAADHVLCISEATRRDVVEMLGIPPEKTTVTLLAASPLPLPDGETAFLAHHFRRPEPFHHTLLFVGQRHGYKNADRLLEALDDPRLADCHVLFVGGEPPSASEIVRANRLERLRHTQPPGRPHVAWNRQAVFQRPNYRVDFLGRVPDGVLGLLYSWASAVVCPSLYEGFGLPVLEAMAEGTVVACSNTSSLPEVAGDCAFYFDPRSPGSIADALVKAMALSEAERRAWAIRAKTRAATFSWHRTAAQTLAVYRQVAK